MADEIVELHPAHMWDCPECGRENFCRCVLAVVPNEERESFAEKASFDPDMIAMMQGDFVTAPDEVTCKFCETTFKTIDQER